MSRMKLKLLPFLVALPCWAACAPEQGAPPPAAPQETRTSPVVYGEDDRLDFHESQSELWRDLVKHSIVALVPEDRIDEGDPENIVLGGELLGPSFGLCDDQRFFEQQRAATCSGTLIEEDLVLTAGHCVDNLSQCRERRFVFNYYEQEPGVLAPVTADEVYRCDSIAARINNNLVDYAVIKLDRPVSQDKRPAPVRRRDDALARGEEVTLIGFPSGIPAKIASGGFVVTPRADTLDYFEASVDAFGGNSGSGVFDNQGQLVGILVRGEQDYTSRNGCSVVNVLGNQRSEEEGAEDITYAARAVEALCSMDWPSESLCGGDERELCFLCESDSQCRDDWKCGAHEESPEVLFCTPNCEQDSDCRADHQCLEGSCLPRLETQCLQGAPWTVDACGRPIAQQGSCQETEFCFEGGCVERGPGDTCADPLVLEPLPQQSLSLSFAGRYAADARGSCAGGGAEAVYSLTLDRPRLLRATATGTDPVLHLRSDCADADSEIACNDDNTPPGGTGSQLELELEPGTYYLFADTFRGSGELALEVEVLPICEVYCEVGAVRCSEDGSQQEACTQEEGAECASWVQQETCQEGQFCREGQCLSPEPGDSCQDAVGLEAVDQRIVEDLRGAWRDSAQGSCGGGGPDAVYTFTVDAPVQLSAVAAGLDSVLYLRRGDCDGQEVACNDDHDPPGSLGSLIAPQLEPGTYFLFVDTFSQERARRFALMLEFLPPCEDACEEGQRRCHPEQEAVQLCQATTQGCLGWGEPIACDDGFVCGEGICAPDCEDECEEGQTRCDGDAVQRCGDFNSDGCLGWSASVGCSGGQVCHEDACTDPDNIPEELDMGMDLDMDQDDAAELWPNPFEDSGVEVSGGKKDKGCQAAPGTPSPTAALWLLLLGLLWRPRR